MEWKIESFQSVGPLRFGMSREAVRRATGAPVREVLKSDSLIDVFENLLIHVYYGADGGVEFVEFGGGLVSPTFEGRLLLANSFEELRRWLRTLDSQLEEDSDGLRSRKLGVALYAPAGEEEPERPPEGASAFAAGYYERYGL